MVLDLYYRQELLMHEVGEVLGVTESRVSQIRSAAITRLRSLVLPAMNPAPSPVQRRRDCQFVAAA